VDITIKPSDDPRQFIDRALAAHCDGMVVVGAEPVTIAWVNAIREAHADSIQWVFLTPAYTSAVAQSLGAQGEGIYAISEFEPWSSRSMMLNDWKAILNAQHIPLTSLSQGGFIAATVFVKVVSAIKGPITRNSIATAFRAMAPATIPMMGTPFMFGEGSSHNPNRAAVPMQLHDGHWRVAYWDYIIEPDSN
jgi:branched-chain amino acid transport system substrate-binding protein